jgi:hypothetical protein
MQPNLTRNANQITHLSQQYKTIFTMENDMKSYIEQRPKVIKAIKGSITHWNNICCGFSNKIGASYCPLCGMFLNTSDSCSACPLGIIQGPCERLGSEFIKYRFAREGSGSRFCTVDSAYEAEAVLKSLIMLLPPEHREEYGG